jgi:esterase/lipase superfamily enzyme
MKALMRFITGAILLPLLLSAGLAQDQSVEKSWLAERVSRDLNASQVYVPEVIEIRGLVASEDVRKASLTQAHRDFPFDIIQDEMRVGPGGVDATSAIFALSQLTRLREGKVQIDSGNLRIVGEARASENVQTFVSDVRSKLPPNLNLSNFDVAPPHVVNFTWSLSRTSDIIRIDGFVPSDATKNAIYADVKNRFGQANIRDSSVVAVGAPDDFLPAARVALNQVEIAQVASAYLSGPNYSIVADMSQPDPWNRSKLEQAFKTTADAALPSSFDGGQFKIVPPAASTRDNRTVDLLFATDRVREDKDLRPDFGSGRSDSLTFGVARVHIPEDHLIGNIELPGSGHDFLGFTFGREGIDPKKHFMLTGTEILDLDKWKEQMTGRNDEALVFVHGYNTSFDDSIFRLAQIVWDLQYHGPAILFSWPSKGNLLSYEWDRNSALFARQHFIELLKLLERDVGIKKVHVLAHSMGNLVVLDALSTYAQTADPLQISQLIMAAPDIDSDQYRQDIQNLSNTVAAMTLYASANDRAMLTSRTLAQGRRAGDVVDGKPILVPGVDAIDVSAVGDEIFGLNHDTFAAKRSLINDINLILEGVRPPNKRLAEIREMPEGSTPPLFWRYVP